MQAVCAFLWGVGGLHACVYLSVSRGPGYRRRGYGLFTRLQQQCGIPGILLCRLPNAFSRKSIPIFSLRGRSSQVGALIISAPWPPPPPPRLKTQAPGEALPRVLTRRSSPGLENLKKSRGLCTESPQLLLLKVTRAGLWCDPERDSAQVSGSKSKLDLSQASRAPTRAEANEVTSLTSPST